MKNKKLRTAAIVLAALIFLGSGARAVMNYMDYKAGDESYGLAADLGGIPLAPDDFEGVFLPDESVPLSGDAGADGPLSTEYKDIRLEEYDPILEYLSGVSLAGLQKVNPDVVGWIYIPGTVISYPIVQGRDNSRYLDTTWDGQSSAVGSIFLDYRSSGSINGYNNIIYGHRMRNGSMFFELGKYAEQSFLEEHPHVYIVDENGCRRYTVFSAYAAPLSGQTFRIDINGGKEKSAYLEYCIASSTVTPASLPTTGDRLITLATCTGTGYSSRWVVQAYLTLQSY